MSQVTIHESDVEFPELLAGSEASTCDSGSRSGAKAERQTSSSMSVRGRSMMIKSRFVAVADESATMLISPAASPKS